MTEEKEERSEVKKEEMGPDINNNYKILKVDKEKEKTVRF